MDERWRIELFGGLRAVRGERVITRFRTQKTGALLAYLAYYLGKSQPREVLMELLWPGSVPKVGRNSLRVALSSLRRQLEPPDVPAHSVILADLNSVRLNPAAVTTDVAEFEAALRAAAGTASSVERVQLLAEAVERYRGELLRGSYENWVITEQRRLEEQFFQALRHLVRYLQQAGDFDRAIQYAQRAINVDPFREESYCDLMRLYAAMGQPSDALRQYHELERILKQELDDTPSAAARALAEQLAEEEEKRRQGEEETLEANRPSLSAHLPAPSLSLSPSPSFPCSLPGGTVTLLMADIEGAPTFPEHTATCEAVLRDYRALLRAEFARHGGYQVKETNDSYTVAFTKAGDALSCAIACQRAVAEHSWPEPMGSSRASSLKVRMALCSGDVELHEGKYSGLPLDRVSRMLLAAHGGQILCSQSTAALLPRDAEPGHPLSQMQLLDLGSYYLRGGPPGEMPVPERLFQVNHPDMAQQEFPLLKADPVHSGVLPLRLTRFFGYEEEIALLSEMLRPVQSPRSKVQSQESGASEPGTLDFRPWTRLVTLTGPGGCGKTRLALEVAQRMVAPWRGAVWFVPLENLSDPQLMMTTVRDALRLPPSPNIEPLEQVVEVLSAQPSLLLLDNFEQLVDGGAEQIWTLLERVPALTLLITSRQRLELNGEREFMVRPLHTPGKLKKGECTPQHLVLNESVQLFVDRAQAVHPDFGVTNANVSAVAQLCDRLEGIPLAIELAAARAQVLTPAQMLAHLEHRLDFLRSRQRNVHPRHYTLRATFDWSYQMLPAEFQRFFARLCEFRGGWTLEAAQAVCSDCGMRNAECGIIDSTIRSWSALEYLVQLRQCSLVLAEEKTETSIEPSPEMRFRMLEIIREYAQEQLAPEERRAIEQRHAEYYLALAEAEPGPGESGKQDEPEWLERLEKEQDNLRAALRWSLENAPEIGVRLAGTLWDFWSVRGYFTEGRGWLERALAKSSEAPAALRARVLLEAADLAFKQGDFTAARAFAQESLAAHTQLGDRQGMAYALNHLGATAMNRGDFAAAHALLEEGLAMARESGDKRAIADLTRGLGMLAMNQGDFTMARSLLEESVAIMRELESKSSLALSLNFLGNVARYEGNDEQAMAYFRESLTLFQELNRRGGIAWVLHNLGWVARCHDDYGEAAIRFRESLILGREMGSKVGIVRSLQGLAGLSAAAGKPERAARLFGAAEALLEAMGTVIYPVERLEYDRDVAATRAGLDEKTFAAEWAAGRVMRLERAITYALEISE